MTNLDAIFLFNAASHFVSAKRYIFAFAGVLYLQTITKKPPPYLFNQFPNLILILFSAKPYIYHMNINNLNGLPPWKDHHDEGENWKTNQLRKHAKSYTKNGMKL